ncbi:hypothetical protein C0J52_08343 [Blattella germanica]|nr:hypothetical protein C0J52_08343 [Blattella germanica]
MECHCGAPVTTVRHTVTDITSAEMPFVKQVRLIQLNLWKRAVRHTWALLKHMLINNDFAL